MNLFFDTDAAVKGEKIGAAAEEDVLAVVDDFIDAGMQVGGGASAEVATAFDELHAIAGFGQCTRGAHAGDSAADDRDDKRDGLVWRFLQVSLRAEARIQLCAVLGTGQSPYLRMQITDYPVNRAIARRAIPAPRIPTFWTVGTLARLEKTS